MYELSRVRLHSVGPPGARYSDVLLDLSGAGAPVSGSQGDLLGDGEPVLRPSPASVLFLENGGGKSVLIKLIFSVMLPGRRQVVGTTSTRVLEKFVLPDDVAHVVVEWVHTETGQRLLTGKASEWRGHVLSADPANLVDSWYCLRPGESVELETLPLTDGNRLRTLSAYRERLAQAQRDDPGLDLFWTRRHNEWTEHLDQRGLDTELFRYQRAMNAGEGEAADAFAFASDEGFVEFLLRAVLSEEEPAELAEVLANYAQTLARRGDLASERDFVAGALELAEPLAREESLAAASRGEAQRAEAELSAFVARLAARDVGEHELAEQRAAEVAELAEAAALAESEHRRRGGALDALRRSVAELRLDEATERQRAADAELAEARGDADAWRETATVLDHAGAVDTGRRLRELARSKEEKAQPALAAKNAAAEALARGLLGLARGATAEADRAGTRAGELAERAAAAQAAQNEATAAAAADSARADQLAERLEDVRGRVRACVADGLLDAATEPATAAAEAADALATATDDLAAQEAEAERLTDGHADAQLRLQEARQRVAAARERRDRADADARRAGERTAALASEPRAVELLDAGAVHLDTDYPALRRRLADARAEGERVRLELEVAEASDRAARVALDGGELLPPPAEVTEVCAVLEDAGVTAWPGWTYLAGLPDVAERARLARLVPQLASGVLLNEAAQLDRAREVLAERGPEPTTFVAVGTTTAVRAAADGPGADFVVPANPALYDPDAAALAQSAIARRHAERQQRLTALAERLRADDELAGRLTAWREEYPPGRVGELAEAAEQATREVDAAEAAVLDAGTELERIAARRVALRERLPDARAGVRDLEDRTRRLAALAEETGNLGEWTEQERLARESTATQQDRAAEAEADAERARAEAAESQRAADAHRGTAERARGELAEVPGAGEVGAGDPVPDEPVDALRRTYRSAAEAYARVEVGSDLRAELDQAERAEAAARAAVEALDPRVRERAAALLETPDGADAAARAAARDRAARAADAAEARRSEAISAVATRRAELAALPAADAVEAPKAPEPRDIAHGLELAESAAAEQAAAGREADRLRSEHETAQRAASDAQTSAEAFRVLLQSATVDPQPGPAEPFDGDVAAARERYATCGGELAHARELAGHAEERVREAADELAALAAEQRFAALDVPVRKQLVSVRRAELPAHAAEWAEALRPRLRTLSDDLEQIDRHRGGIVTRLHGMVEDALRTLRSAQRVSRLPDGLGDWSGQEFLRVAFGPLEDAVLAERLGEVVDEAAVGRTPEGREVKRDGMSLLLRGVLAAAPRGFRVEMLKPDAVLRTERQRVSEIRDVFSGGQQLTAAIMLYCTMAALRANNRGRARNRHSGVLFLDNPIGRASAGYLLELQRAVAAALGVQLIYTTGLFDANALAEFPMIVRLRNDADLRAGRKYLSVDETIRAELDALPEPDDTAGVTATRVYLPEHAGTG